MDKKEYNKIIADNFQYRQCDRHSWLGHYGWWKLDVPSIKQLRSAMNRKQRKYSANASGTLRKKPHKRIAAKDLI